MKLKFKGFMSHDDSEVELPSAGIILVTGPNGAGKSAIAEAISYGLWGKMLRGDTPWRDDETPGLVAFHVEHPELDVARLWSGKQQKLSFAVDGNKAEVYETRTKCQEALEAIIGPYDLWRRSCVFSSSDAASFSTATDAERKRMLEKLLGLEWFDAALKASREDLKEAARELERATERLEALEARKGDIREKVDFYTNQLEESADADDLSAEASKLKKYKKLRAASKEEVKVNSKGVQRKQQEVTRSEAKLEQLTEQLDALAGQSCHTCGQPVPDEVRTELETALTEETERLAGLRTSAEEWLSDIKEDITAAQSEIDELTSRIEEVGGQVQVSQAQVEARTKAERGVKQAKLDLKTIEASAVTIEESLDKVKPKVAELEACSSVLGLKGVRAHVLGETLGSIEGVANRWLDQLSEGKLQMTLKPYSDKGVKDAISLKVKGGNFARASGGERRRVDVSILLALSQIGLSTVGVQDGWPLIFDEVFDALDPQGIAQVLKALNALSMTRPAIVITHSYVDDLAELADLVIHVEDGVIV